MTAKNAQPQVAAANAAVLSELPFSDHQDYVDAERGFIASLPDATIQNSAGRQVWSIADYAFLKDDHAPATVIQVCGDNRSSTAVMACSR